MIRLAFAFLLSLCVSAQAQLSGGVGGFPGPGTKHSTGSGFVGIGDVVSGASQAVGLVAYNAAYGTGPAADICDMATGLTCSTINFLSDGSFDVTTAAAASACTVSCGVKKLYDSTGNGRDCTQATASRMPVLTFNALGTKPGLTFTNANNSHMTCGTTAWGSQPYTLVSVAKHTNSGVQQSLYSMNNASSLFEFGIGGANTISIFDGASVTATAADNSTHVLQGIWNGGSSNSKIVVNATTTTGSLGTTAGSGTIAIGARASGGQVLDGVGHFWVAYPSVAFNGTQATNVCNNQFTYWGTPTSC